MKSSRYLCFQPWYGYTDSIRKAIYDDYKKFRLKGYTKSEALKAAEDLWFDVEDK
jgi:hypothetical protein